MRFLSHDKRQLRRDKNKKFFFNWRFGFTFSHDVSRQLCAPSSDGLFLENWAAIQNKYPPPPPPLTPDSKLTWSKTNQGAVYIAHGIYVGHDSKKSIMLARYSFLRR